MTLRRGVLYALSSPRPTGAAIAAIVLTNDIWNDRMADVGVVFATRPHSDSPLHPIVSSDPPLQAVPSAVRAWPKAWLGRPLVVLDPPQLNRVEDALCDLLALRALLADPARLPRAPGGPVRYPAWGNLYYIQGQQYAAQHKRYLVVSHDQWNARAQTVLAVRTTTRTKWPATSFPYVERGEAQACCGNLSSFRAARFEHERSFQPRWLPLADMRAVAAGIVETHSLGEAVARVS